MTDIVIYQVLLYLLIILLLVKPLGTYMAQVYDRKSCVWDRYTQPLEQFFYRFCRIDPEQEMEWKNYLVAMLLVNFFGFLVAYAIQRLQVYLPLNPQSFPNVPAELAFNTAASFTTNTDWQAYGGENTLSYVTQMLALTVENFLSAATGMSLVIALIRGLVRRETGTIGNFWVDTVRGILYILIPLSIILSVILVSQGVIQNINPYKEISLLETLNYQQPVLESSGHPLTDQLGHPKIETKKLLTQTIPMGPVASQVAIKQLGTNGGGFFNTNSAHPFENPTPLSNFFEMLAILLIPAALCYTFGIMVNDKRQCWAIICAMFLLFLPPMMGAIIIEQQGNPGIEQLGIDNTLGNMEGKETRFGAANSALWATVTTTTSNGSTNSMHDSYLPLAGLMPLWLMHLGEVAFGGVGSGLYGMLMLVIITVFVAGLMVGRTPEYLGKKIEPYEMKMASMAVLIMPLFVLLFTAIGAVTTAGTSAIANPGAHGLSEILYAFTSMVNNNGSAFAGINANTFFYNFVGGIAMLIGRFWIAIPVLAIAGSLASKKVIPRSAGTLPTHTLFFIGLLVSVAVILGALTFFPVLALGPIVEQLILWGKHG